VASSYNGNCIEFIDIENKKLLKWVTLEGSAIGGIEVNKDNMFVGRTGKVYILDYQGNTTGESSYLGLPRKYNRGKFISWITKEIQLVILRQNLKEPSGTYIC
jgi:hypothetical protein